MSLVHAGRYLIETDAGVLGRTAQGQWYWRPEDGDPVPATADEVAEALIQELAGLTIWRDRVKDLRAALRALAS